MRIFTTCQDMMYICLNPQHGFFVAKLIENYKFIIYRVALAYRVSQFVLFMNEIIPEIKGPDPVVPASKNDAIFASWIMPLI